GHTLALQRELADEVGDGRGAVAAMWGPVEDDREHGENSGKTDINSSTRRPTRQSRRGSAAVMPHRGVQEAKLSFESGAGRAPEKVQANARPLPERDVPILHLRDQAARIPARNHSAHCATSTLTGLGPSMRTSSAPGIGEVPSWPGTGSPRGWSR